MALKCDIKPFEFWEYTIQEVLDLIEAYNEKEKQKMQFDATCGYNSALVIVNEVRNMFNKGGHEVLQIGDLYPYLFDSEEIEKKRQEREAEANAERMKANLLAYANAWNKKLRKE